MIRPVVWDGALLTGFVQGLPMYAFLDFFFMVCDTVQSVFNLT